MARITWLGDAECAWNDVVFPPGVPVETDDPYMIGKARNNPFFRLDEGVPRPQGTVYGITPETWTNPPLDYTPADDVFGDPLPAMHKGTMEEIEQELVREFGPINRADQPPKRKRGRPPKVRHNGE